jgi:hypothetical protein
MRKTTNILESYKDQTLISRYHSKVADLRSSSRLVSSSSPSILPSALPSNTLKEIQSSAGSFESRIIFVINPESFRNCIKTPMLRKVSLQQPATSGIKTNKRKLKNPHLVLGRVFVLEKPSEHRFD